MKDTLISLIKQAISSITSESVDIQLTRTKDETHGDFATNIAMALAKKMGQNPRELAQKIIDALPASPIIIKVEMAGPGFINFFLNANSEHDAIKNALSKKKNMAHHNTAPIKKFIWNMCLQTQQVHCM